MTLQPDAMLIYKIVTAEEWQTLEVDGQTAGAPVDLADGYIHFSTGVQVRETAAKHFAGQDGLMLLAIDTDAFSAELKWEQARGGDWFPHLYRPLLRAEVAWAVPLPLGPGGHDFPETP